MRVDSVEGNSQRLDGGSMFGNCPRAVWSRWVTPDAEHRIPLACRCLLVREASGRTLLFETGVGAFFDPKRRQRYGVEQADHRLLRNLAALGVAPDAVDVVVLSHLHFDHAGGVLTAFEPGGPPTLAFPRARFVVSRRAWERARAPHPRDRASFIPELPRLLEASGKLELVQDVRSRTLGDAYHLTCSEGHTPGQLLTRVDTSRGPVQFLGDLVPGVPWLHLPITMGYDRYPERLIDEKQALLDELAALEGWAFFVHDPDVAVARLERDAQGRYRARNACSELHW